MERDLSVLLLAFRLPSLFSLKVMNEKEAKEKKKVNYDYEGGERKRFSV